MSRRGILAVVPERPASQPKPPDVPEGDSTCRRFIVTAAVKDVEAWLKFKADMTAALSAVASDGSSYVAADGSNQVCEHLGRPRHGGLPGSAAFVLAGIWRRRRNGPG